MKKPIIIIGLLITITGAFALTIFDDVRANTGWFTQNATIGNGSVTVTINGNNGNIETTGNVLADGDMSGRFSSFERFVSSNRIDVNTTLCFGSFEAGYDCIIGWDSVNQSGGDSFDQNLNTTANVTFNRVGLGGKLNPSVALQYDNEISGGSRVARFDVNVTSGIGSALDFYLDVPTHTPNTGTVGAIGFSTNLNNLDDRTGSTIVEGLRNTIGGDDVVKTGGTETIRGVYNIMSSAAHTGGNHNYYGVHTTLPNSYTLAGSAKYNTYGEYIKSGTPLSFASGTVNRYGVYLEGFSKGGFDNVSFGIYDDGGNWFTGGDLNVSGDSYISVPYAEMYNNTVNGYTVTIGSLNSFVNITDLVVDESNQFTTATSKLTLLHAGVYKIDTSVSFSGSGGSTHQLGVLINGFEHEPCTAYRKLGAAGDVGNAGSTCLLTGSVGDEITLAIADINAPAQNVAVWNANLNIMRVGE